MPFEERKNAVELNIDISRKFRVVEGNGNFKLGTIITLSRDDDSWAPLFIDDSGEKHYAKWQRLEYADEPTKFKVGDHVRIIGKNGGWISFDTMKTSDDCPNLNDTVIRTIDGGGGIGIGNYAFHPQDLELITPVSAENLGETIQSTYDSSTDVSPVSKTPLNNSNNNPTPKADSKTMQDNIISFFKDLTVSGDDKDLRKAGLKDGELRWTSEARQIVIDKEAIFRGYKDGQDLSNKTNSNTCTPLELDTLYTKYAADLLALAKKFNAREEKKAKK